MEINQQLKKGVLNILILNSIAKKDQYGYELIQELQELSDDYYTLKEGSLYPVFYRLEDLGFIESYKVEVGDRKVSRKYYKITEKGLLELKEMKATWCLFVEKTQKVIGGCHES
ncbi:MAG: helix-turn-helix transcriptional regulator [Clostridia bacterium]|nr:helix-turn-helix transcriptional regulator [Clostridia bacterium]